MGLADSIKSYISSTGPGGQSGVLFQLSSDGFNFKTSCLPTGFRISKGANFNPIDIIGRSSPIITYSSSSSMTVDIQFELHADGQGLTAPKISDLIRSLMGLTFPKKAGIQPPSLCYITAMGTILEDWQCVCSNVDATPGNIPVFDQEGNPHHAEIALKFIGIEIENVNASEWLKGGNFEQTAFIGSA